MSELSRTILAGTGQIQDAFRTAITARADKRRRKQVALQSASEAFKGIGDTIKEYGDWRDAKAAEKDVRGFQEDYALGLSTGGPEAALVAVTARRPSTGPGATTQANIVTRLEEMVRKNREDNLDRAKDWYFRQQEAKRRKANDRWGRYVDKAEIAKADAEAKQREAARQKAEEDLRYSSEKWAAFASKVQAGNAVTLGDMLEAATNKDGTPNQALLEQIRMSMQAISGKAGPVPDPALAKYAEDLGAQYTPGMDDNDIRADAELRAKRNKPEEPKKESDKIPRDVNKAYDIRVDRADKAWSAWRDSMGQQRDPTLGVMIDPNPEDIKRARRAYLKAADEANLYAVQKGMEPPYGDITKEFEDDDAAWFASISGGGR